MWKILSQIALKNTNNSHLKTLLIQQNKNLRILQRYATTDPKPSPNISHTNPKTSSSSNNTSSFRKLMLVFASGAVAYFSISYYLDNRQKSKPSGEINYKSKNLPGHIKPTLSLHREKNPGNVKITLYQYVTCPFCCKVRAYLDYYGYSYDIVEVNSINKAQLDWSSYKKVPTLAIQVPSQDIPDKYDETIIQLNDSSVVISALETFRLDPSSSLTQINKYYEPLEVEGNDKSKVNDFVNKYFVMLHNEKVTDGKDVSERKDERDWRRWVDTKFVHVISPNVYRTFSEALDAFNWFDEIGNWKSHFNSFERASVIYLGSLVMYIIGRRLKKKHNLKEDVRLSMYEMCDEWVKSLNGQFKGGSKPNLADLALYGVIGSFEGCEAFNDMMNNTKIRNWYEACKDQVVNSKGGFYLNNPNIPIEAEGTQAWAVNEQNQDNNANKKQKKFYIF